MWSQGRLQQLLIAATILLGCFCTAQGKCKTDGGLACPAQDTITPVRDGYDPSAVDWNAVVADVYALSEAEPRLCTMALRAWFHDIGGHRPPDHEHQDFDIGGADASVMTHDAELRTPESAPHGFMQIVRHVMVQMAAAHGSSHADILTVFSATCPKTLGSTLDIPSHCEAEGFPLYVGKQDYERSDDYHQKYPIHTTRTRHIPPPHTRIPSLYNYFLQDINALITKPDWQLTQQDATALMGAHGTIFTQNCMTDGTQPNGTAPGLSDRTCSGAGGTQRMFKWSNHYWQDVSSGTCLQAPFRKTGRDLTLEEDAELTTCAWNTVEGFHLSEVLECDAMEDVEETLAEERADRQAKGKPEHRLFDMEFHENRGQFSLGWKATKWTPDPATAAPCCGYTCQTCNDNPEGKFWCSRSNDDGDGNVIVTDDRYFPYGYLDCDWNLAYQHGSSYCDPDSKQPNEFCEKHWGKKGKGTEIRDLMDKVKPLMDKYAGSAPSWEQDYALAFCKFSDFAADYVEKKITLMSVFSEPSSGCLDVQAAMSPKGCRNCQIAARDPALLEDYTATSPTAAPQPSSTEAK